VTDILKQLIRGSWREIEYPISGREYGFAQEQARHRFIFRDNQLIESLGRESPTYRYTIPFREDIAKGPYENLFTRVYPDFLDACLDRTRGVLTDPVHGSLPAKCVSLREILDVNKRDGIDVEVEFIKAPQESDFAENLGTQLRTLEGAKGAAGLFDQELQKIDWKQELPPENTINPLDFASSVGNQIEVAGGQVSAQLADMAFRLEKSVATIDRLRNPNLAPTRQRARRLQGAILALEDRVDITGTKPLRKVEVSANMTISALAAKVNMTVEQLLKLNPHLRRGPLVKAGTEIKVTADTLAKPAPSARP
jgi:prophage DNA circulation protein